MGPAYLLWRCIDVFVVYLCDPSDLSNIINVIYLANFNHHLSCFAALHKGLYVQQVHTFNLCGVVSKTVVPPSGVGQCYPSGVARYYANRLQPVQ